MVPKLIRETIENFEYQDISDWLKDLLFFFYNPFSILKKFQNSNKQFPQLVFYSVLTIVILAMSFKGFQVSNIESYKILLSISIYCIPFTILNYLSIRIFLKINFWIILKSVLLFLLISSIFSFITLSLFISNENYVFLFINTCINVLLLIYLIIIFPIQFTNKMSNKILCVLTNLFFFNVLCALLLFVIRTDQHSNIKSVDPIYNEHQISVTNIKSFEGEPYSITKVIYPNGQNFYKTFTYKRNDSIFRNDGKMLIYFKKLFHDNTVEISKSADSLNFKRNKNSLKLLGEYFHNLETMFNYDYDEKLLISKTVFVNSNKDILHYEKEFRIDKNIIKPYSHFMETSQQIYEGNQFANKPIVIISFLLIPASYFFKTIDYQETNVLFQL